MQNKYQEDNNYKSYLIAFIATLVRYYDYGLFGLSAGMISKHIMPDQNNSDQLLIFFSIMQISVIFRPVGSYILGTIGDKYGRTVTLKISTIIAALSTFFIGLIPNFYDYGITSIIILLILRIIFIMSLAGEIDAIKIYVAEKLTQKEEF